MKFEFNTRRLYAKDGQLIKCEHRWSEKICSNVITFCDTARHIEGWIVYCGGTGDERLLAERVLAAYDNMCYASGIYENV